MHPVSGTVRAVSNAATRSFVLVIDGTVRPVSTYLQCLGAIGVVAATVEYSVHGRCVQRVARRAAYWVTTP